MRSRSNSLLVPVLLLLVLLSLVAGLSPREATVVEAQSSGWLSGWFYRKQHVINPASGAGSNYAVNITVYYGDGTDSGAEVYLGGKCRSDFGDIRFTASDGVTLLDYWMEEKVDGVYARFWVRIPDDLSSSPVTIYIYYGNPDATYAGDGTRVFLFFDDFETGDLSRWTSYAADSVSVVVDEAGNKVLQFSVSTTGDGSVVKYVPHSNVCLHFKLRVLKVEYLTSSGYVNFYTYLRSQDSSLANTYSAYMHYAYAYGTTPRIYLSVDTSTQWIYPFYLNVVTFSGSVLLADAVANSYAFNVTYSNYFCASDSTLGALLLNGPVVSAADPTFLSGFYVALRVSGADANAVFWVDDVFLRKYVEPEPAHGSWGPEEVYLTLTVGVLHEPARLYLASSIRVSSNLPLVNVTVAFQNGTLLWVNGTGLSSTGPVLAVRASESKEPVWVNLTYVPLPGFQGGGVSVSACTSVACRTVVFDLDYVPGYSLDLSVQPRTTVGTVPWYSASTNYTGTVELHNLNAYLNLTPPAPLQPGDVLAPHMFDWYFDGVDDRVRVPVSSTLSNFTAKSVVLWLKPLSYPDVWEPYDHGYWVSPFGDLFQNIRTSLVYFLKNTGGTVASLSYTLPSELLYAWIHVATSWDGSIARLYVNGVNVRERSFSGVLASSAYSLTIGSRYSGTYPYKGLAGGVLIYRRALTSEEIQQMNSGEIINASGLALFLDATFYDGSRYVDLSGNGNHGYPYGGVQRVPAERTWLWVVRGLTSDPVVWLRFFPSGTIVVFADGSATVVSGPVNAVGLVEEFAVGRTDITYVLVPHPSRWSERSVLTRDTVGELRFVAWMNVSTVYPLRTAVVVYDKLLISRFSTSAPNATRIDAFRTSVDVCVSLVHAYDGQPVTGGAVMIAGRQAVFNGTCWATSIPPPGNPVGSRNYTVVSSATSNLNISFVDPSPVLIYVHDALVARVVSVDYINQTAVLELRYASDNSPAPSGRVGVLY
ncbi:MAG: DUF2341 domain-containing protein, partial [Thermofilum sp.]